MHDYPRYITTGFSAFDPIELADYVCGDANGDGITDLGDAIYELNQLFKGGETPDPFEAGDVNCDGMLDLGDAIYLLNYLFKQGPYPGCF